MSNEIFEINEEELMQVAGADGTAAGGNVEINGDYPQIDNDPPG